MSYVNISAAIVSILQANVPKLRHVYDYERLQPEGYPCATVTPDDGEAEFADTSRNKRTYIFSIKIKQERVQQNEEESERIMRELVDQAIATFDDRDNISLSNTVIFAQPVPSKWTYEDAPDSTVRVAEILLRGTTVPTT